MAAKGNEELLEFCDDTWEVNRRVDVRRKMQSAISETEIVSLDD